MGKARTQGKQNPAHGRAERGGQAGRDARAEKVPAIRVVVERVEHASVFRAPHLPRAQRRHTGADVHQRAFRPDGGTARHG